MGKTKLKEFIGYWGTIRILYNKHKDLYIVRLIESGNNKIDVNFKSYWKALKLFDSLVEIYN